MGEYVWLRRVRMWCEERGSGEPVVLLHGGALDSRFWSPVRDRLARRFQVIAPDTRGHGRSSAGEGPLSHRAMAGDLVEFLETMIVGPVHLVGQDEGAMVAVWVALWRPDLVDRLVLVSPAFRENGEPSANRLDIAGTLDLFTPDYGDLSPDYPAVVRAFAARVAAGPSISRADVMAITQPTLVMCGDTDLTLGYCAQLRTLIGDCELAVVPGTGYFFLREKPVLCTEILERFLTR